MKSFVSRKVSGLHNHTHKKKKTANKGQQENSWEEIFKNTWQRGRFKKTAGFQHRYTHTHSLSYLSAPLHPKLAVPTQPSNFLCF